MKIATLVLAFLALASVAPAQKAMGVGGNIKPAKVSKAKIAKEKKSAPLYTAPKSAHWYEGGGPGIAGAH